jgi:probable HAF family extracellular repeat protein
MRGKRLAALIGPLLLLSLGTAVLALPPGYIVTDLGDLGGEKSYPVAVNDHAQVVGYSDTWPGAAGQEYRAFLWSKAFGMQELDLPPGPAEAYDINNAGQIVGYYGRYTGFVLHGGARTDIEAFCDDGDSWAFGINEHGHVVGKARAIYVDPWGEEYSDVRPFLLRDGVMTNLGMFGYDPEWADPFTVDVNDGGTVLAGVTTPESGAFSEMVIWSEATGARTFMWGEETNGRDINNLGHVVGDFFDYGREAFLWHDDVRIILGTLGGNHSGAFGINDLGQVVGWSDTNPPGGQARFHAFVWEDGAMVDLNDLIPADSGWELIEAYDINSTGWIIGFGKNPLGHHRGFILEPIPEPATLALLALGGLALLSRRRR